MTLRVLRNGSNGADVRRWQVFLVSGGIRLPQHGTDGDFGDETDFATRVYQENENLAVDGVVGPKTYAAAMVDGFDAGIVDESGDLLGPSRPDGVRRLTQNEKAALFEPFDWKHTPTDRNAEKITVSGPWKARNLVGVHIPQLVNVNRGRGQGHDGNLRVHRLIADQFVCAFAEFDRLGLAGNIIAWGGMYVARLIRGSRTSLSSHSYATAFDINAAWNGRGKMPAMAGRRGSVRELVMALHRFGFFWGGWWDDDESSGYGRWTDGMHFEANRVVSEQQLADLGWRVVDGAAVRIDGDG